MSSETIYGKFDQDGQRYVLTTPVPPRPWVNLHFSGPQDNEYYSHCTNYGTGQTTCRDKTGVKCTLIREHHKIVYLRDDDSHACWNIGQFPLNNRVSRYRCVYTQAATTLSSVFRGIRASQRVFVPQGATHEFWTLTLENTSKRPRRLSLFAHAEFMLWGFPAPGSYYGPINHRADYVEKIGGVWARNRNRFCPNERFKGYLICSRKPDAYECDYRRVYGPDGSFIAPAMVVKGLDAQNRACDRESTCATLQTKLELLPGQSIRLDYALGQCASLEEIGAVRRTLLDPGAIEAALQCVEQNEAALASRFHIETGHPVVDPIMNHWIKKQMKSYIVYKSGFRDSLQIDDALCMADYALAETDFLKAISFQHPEGHAPHAFRPLDTKFSSDQPAWILLTAPGLIKESGDLSLLDRQVPYRDGKDTGTVWDHMLRAMRWLCADLGTHGLCRQHHCDWNDGLEETAESGERESVMVTQQLCYGLLRMAEVAALINNRAIEHEAREQYALFKNRLNEVAWDGHWYARSFCADSFVIGSHQREEGRIFLNTQSWAVLSQTASAERARQAFKAVDEQIETDVGFRICFPPYSAFDPRVGRISTVHPGKSENGGCYNHAAGFKIAADCMLGRNEAAWRTVLKMLPNSPWNPASRSFGEPFATVNSYSASETSWGLAGIAWRTGSCGWICKGILEWILGVRRDYPGLLIDPCLPADLKTVTVKRIFRNTNYLIQIDNRSSRNTGAQKITVDGVNLAGRHLPVFNDGATHKVNITV
jgi:cellobiose phosphorylase